MMISVFFFSGGDNDDDVFFHHFQVSNSGKSFAVLVLGIGCCSNNVVTTWFYPRLRATKMLAMTATNILC